MDTGFDRGVDFTKKKDEFIREFDSTVSLINDLDEGDRYYMSKRKKIFNKLIYLAISMIQLCNGSRISEACNAFKQFLSLDKYDEKVIVKIAKSQSIKYKKSGEKYTTKARYRALIFPSKWFRIMDEIKYGMNEHIGLIDDAILKKRVLDYLLNNHECNTHSLRYAYINHMLYTLKKEPSLVAKHVGHSNLNQIVRYTQQKESQKLFELDI